MSSRLKNQHIVVTGIGVVSPIGIGKSAFWESLRTGRSGIGPVSLFDTSKLTSKLGGEITNFKEEEIIGQQGLRNLDRSIKLALCATKLALTDGGLEVSQENTGDIGIVLGTAAGNIHTISGIDRQSIKEGPKSIEPGQCPNVVLCSPASQVSIRFRIRGFTTTISGGFNSFFAALGYALNMLRAGRAKYILVGAVEELCEETYKAFYRLGLLSGSINGRNEINAPFDRRRNGFVFGEGAAVFLLESLETALHRKTKIYSEITGFYEQNFPQRYPATPRVCYRDADKIIEDCVASSNIRLEDIDFVSLGANSSVLRDAIESRAMQCLSKTLRKYPVGSTVKSLIGETYSAGGAFQLASALFCLDSATVFPTAGYSQEDERCPTPFLVREETGYEVNKCLLWSIGNGRSNYYVACSKSSG